MLALAVMAAVMMIQAIFGASPALALNERPGDTYTTNGKVYATALSGDGKTLYIGGQFSEVRERPVRGTTGISLAVTTWRPSTSRPAPPSARGVRG